MTRTHACLASLFASAMLVGCAADPPPYERTDEGLVRVPSRSYGGVYRLPEATFHQYRRLILETPSVSFPTEWRKQHPEVTDADVRRIQAEAQKMFREEFVRELVERGPYKMADAPDADVLLVSPRIVDLDIRAPDADVEPGTRRYTPGPVKFEVTGEVTDAKSGALVGRIVMFEGEERYGFNELRMANRATNAHEMRIGFQKWSRLFREALNVASAEKR